MAKQHGSWMGLLGALSLVGFSVASCSSAPSTYDQGSDESTGSSSDAVTGAVGDWTGYTDGQCVVGAYHFFESRFGASFIGLCAQGANIGNCENCGACMIWNGPRVEPNPAVWNRYAWGTVTPQLYDMVVFPASGGGFGYGHVAVVDHMSGSAMYVMDSNWYGNEKMATAVHTVPRTPYGIYRLKTLDDALPRGYIDSASCSAVSGWAQDPTSGASAINADLYYDGPAGNPSAVGIRLMANVARPDLCAPIGSCDHGYSMATPRGAMDGKAHTVYAYGIDSTGGNNPLLANSPMSFTCPTPPIAPTSIKRAIPSMDIVNAWKLSTFFDMAPYTDAQLAAIPDGPAFDQPPTLEQATGTPDIFVVDDKQRRHIGDMTSFTAWRFTADMVKAVAATDLDAIPAGLDWPATPLLVKGDSATVYVLDESVNPAAAPAVDGGTAGKTPTSTPNGSASNGASGGSGGSDSGGCSITHATNRSGNSPWILVSLAGLALVRRRRPTRQ